MRTLFDTTRIGSITLKNRFIRSATWESMADLTGRPTRQLVDLYEELALGGVGMIITGATTIVPDPTGLPGMMSIADDTYIPAYQEMTSKIHRHGVPVIMQITYVGKGGTWTTPVDLSEIELRDLTIFYADAAERAQKAGFDGIQIHAGHGFFLSQFQNSRKNKRTDRYGGEVSNRARFILEMYDIVRSRVGNDFGVFIKINCGDFEDEDDRVFETCRYTCSQLSERKIDGIEVTGGAGNGLPLPPMGKYEESVLRDFAAMIAEEVETPVMMVGMNRDFTLMSELLEKTKISYFSMSRPFIREPDLIMTWKNHQEYKSACTSCNACRKQDIIRCPFRSVPEK